MSKAKRGWKVGRRNTSPTHDQRLVSHTPVAPTSGSLPYFSNSGPATGRRAQHHVHPLRVRPLPSAIHAGQAISPAKTFRNIQKTITHCLKLLQENAIEGDGLRASFRTWGMQNSVPTPILSKLRTPSPCHHGHPLVCLLQN